MDFIKIRLLMLITVLAVAIIAKTYGYHGTYGDLISFGIACLFLVILLLYTYKNKSELIKRCILATPFALLLIVVLRVVGFKNAVSIYSGLALFLSLLIKTENIKLHFIITLTTVTILAILSASFMLLNWNRSNMNIYKVYIILGTALPFISFYIAYLGAVHLQKNIELRLLLSRAIKFSGATFLLFVVFTISHMLCRHYNLGLLIPLAISVLLSLCFLWVCRHFKISLSDSSANDKSNKIINQEPIDKLRMEQNIHR